MGQASRQLASCQPCSMCVLSAASTGHADHGLLYARLHSYAGAAASCRKMLAGDSASCSQGGSQEHCSMVSKVDACPAGIHRRAKVRQVACAVSCKTCRSCMRARSNQERRYHGQGSSAYSMLVTQCPLMRAMPASAHALTARLLHLLVSHLVSQRHVAMTGHPGVAGGCDYASQHGAVAV